MAEEITFDRSDCALFSKYPRSINFNEVTIEDKEHFRSIRTKLKQLVSDAAQHESQRVAMQAHTSVLNPNGRNPSDLWCCIYPQAAPNKSFSLQIATIISPQGCEICFCLGAGTAQVKDPAEIQRNSEAWEKLRLRLKQLSPELIHSMDKTLAGDWQYRRQWRQVPNTKDFDSFTDWLSYAASTRGDGASISKNLPPEKLESLGGDFRELFEQGVAIFMPLIEAVYTESTETSENQDFLLEKCLKELASLRVDKEDGTPRLYKPATIYAILKAIEAGELRENKIYYDWLLPRFIETMKKLGKDGDERQAAAAFFHLKGENFWKLKPKDGENLATRGEPAQIRKFIDHAYFSDEFWAVLSDSSNHEKIRETLMNHWFVTTNSEQGEPFEYEKASKELIADIARIGFNFEPWQVASYLVALRTKPFLILGGVSGTGKSQLPILAARRTGAVSELVPVRPDWTDSSDILGYVDLQGELRPGPLLKIASEASKNPDRFYLCIVDEMNLARVEHYFAEVLSRIEESRATGADKVRLLNHTLSAKDQHWGEVSLPSNLAIVGTVNMDESTHGFSKKVIDRAFTIEFSEIDLSAWEFSNAPASGGRTWPIQAWQPRAIRPGAISELSDAEREDVIRIVSHLQDLNGILTQAQLQLAYRSRDEITMFVLHAKDLAELFVTKKGDSVDPLDLAIQMKVLPRIAGGSGAIRR
ncbi:MAG: AAA family ATPase, partial [Candidatus Obscuribacterales bacterium]|nr:AAA family ATPase [Candidatus Obscuribacterales bacterium]